MAIDIKFGSYDFTDTIETWRVRQGITLDTASVPRRDGLVIQGGKQSAREYELTGSLMSDTSTGLRTLRDSLLAGIMNKTANLTLFDDRFVEARVANYADDYVQGSALLAMVFNVIFVSTLPFERSVTFNSDSTVTTTSGNTDIVINNAGNVATFTKITITAPGGGISNNLSIQNTTNSQLMTFTGDISASTDLVIDAVTNPKPSVANDGTDAYQNFTGYFIKLDPGNNTIRAITDIGATVKIEWYDAWI